MITIRMMTMITQEANLGSKADKMRRVWEPTYIVVYREAREDGERPGSSQSRRGSNLPQLPITANTQCSMDEVLQLIRQLYIHCRQNSGAEAQQPLTTDDDHCASSPQVRKETKTVLTKETFYSKKITNKIVTQIQDPLVLSSNALPDW